MKKNNIRGGMPVKVTNKRKFIFSSSLMMFMVILIISVATTTFRKKGNEIITATSPSAAAKYIPLESGKDGNIEFEENEFFRKYTIKTEASLKDIKFVENSDSIDLSLDESVKLKLGETALNSYKNQEIYKKSKDNNVLTIKKAFPENNFVSIDSRDSRNIVVLISKSADPFKYKVVLDPGHGGEDKGVNEGSLYEKDIVLKIAKLMVDDLRYNGCKVKLTRDSDILNSLSQVADISNNENPNVFLSIHINSFTDPKYSGIGAYYYENDPSQLDERVRFASTIQKYALKDDGWKDRGLFRDKLKVLRLSNAPCALVECGFLTNSDDKARLQNDSALKRLAHNLSDGIVEYLKTSK